MKLDEEKNKLLVQLDRLQEVIEKRTVIGTVPIKACPNDKMCAQSFYFACEKCDQQILPFEIFGSFMEQHTAHISFVEQNIWMDANIDDDDNVIQGPLPPMTPMDTETIYELCVKCKCHDCQHDTVFRIQSKVDAGERVVRNL